MFWPCINSSDLPPCRSWWPSYWRREDTQDNDAPNTVTSWWHPPGFLHSSVDNDQAKPRRKSNINTSFLSPCKTNQPWQQHWADQISFLLNPSKETWSNWSFFFLSATSFGSQNHWWDQLHVRANRGVPLARVVPLQDPTESPFPGAEGEDSLKFTEKKKKLLLITAWDGVGIGSTVLEMAHHSQPKVKIIPTTLLAIRKTNSNL